jgi:hypothetical protein
MAWHDREFARQTPRPSRARDALTTRDTMSRKQSLANSAVADRMTTSTTSLSPGVKEGRALTLDQRNASDGDRGATHARIQLRLGPR